MARPDRATAAGRLRALLAASLIAFCVVPAPASAQEQPAQSTPSLGAVVVHPLDAQGQPLRSSYFKQRVEPGETFTGTLSVTNGSAESLRLRVYPARGMTGTTTGIVYGERGDRGGMAGWTTVDTRTLRLAARETQQVGFRVDVPADARPGDHIAAITFENPPIEKADGQFAIDQVMRTAIAVHLRVGGRTERHVRVGGLSIKPLGGTQVPAIVTPLTNAGNLFCRALLTATLEFDGQRVGTVERKLDSILPGDTLSYELAWPKPLAAGTYRATVSASGCGAVAQTTQDVTLTDALQGTVTQPGTVITDGGSGGVPLWALFVTAGVALAGGLLLARRRPRRDD